MQITKPMAKAISLMKEHGTLKRRELAYCHYHVFEPDTGEFYIENVVNSPTISRLIMAGLAEWTDRTEQVVRYIDRDKEIAIVNSLAAKNIPKEIVERMVQRVERLSFCPVCGSATSPIARFCSWCGQAVKERNHFNDQTAVCEEEEVGDADGSAEEEQVQLQEG
jgi:predicted nucleic acid-binding Zn ribbon protein